MRADLHVHSCFSEPQHYRRAGLRDCYSKPGEIYDAAKAAGMDLVTITDRDTIDGCLRLAEERGDPPDLLTGEEAEAALPGSDLRVHVNVWGIRESQHAEIARRRGNIEDLVAYLKAEKVAFCFNHFVGALPVDLPSAAVYRRVLAMFDALEVRNGSQGRFYNGVVAELAAGEASRRSPLAFVGGSDAHTLRRVGATWTRAEARSREEFLEAIRAGRTEVGGRVGRPSDIVLDIASLTLAHYAALWRRGREGANGAGTWPREVMAAAAAVPIQVLGAPVLGTALYLWRTRQRARSLRREIALLDLLQFRERMSSFPRRGDERDGESDPARPAGPL